MNFQEADIKSGDRFFYKTDTDEIFETTCLEISPNCSVVKLKSTEGRVTLHDGGFIAALNVLDKAPGGGDQGVFVSHYAASPNARVGNLKEGLSHGTAELLGIMPQTDSCQKFLLNTPILPAETPFDAILLLGKGISLQEKLSQRSLSGNRIYAGVPGQVEALRKMTNKSRVYFANSINSNPNEIVIAHVAKFVQIHDIAGEPDKRTGKSSPCCEMEIDIASICQVTSYLKVNASIDLAFNKPIANLPLAIGPVRLKTTTSPWPIPGRVAIWRFLRAHI
jgi:hypothetical protein